MTSSADRKKYWDLFETLRWIETRDELMVVEMRDRSDDDRMALAVIGKLEPRVLRSPPEGSDIKRRPDLARLKRKGMADPRRRPWTTCSEKYKAVAFG